MYKNLIFDLGGVILPIDFKKVASVFSEYGFSNFDDVYSQVKQQSFIDDFEEGKCSADKFRSSICEILQTSMTDEQIDSAWCAMLLELPPAHIDLLRTLKTKYRLFLLSNTNEIHVDYMKRKFKEILGFDFFDTLFEHSFLSHEIGVRKPKVSAFEKVLHLANIDPHETLLIDDNISNIESAKQTGLHAYHLSPPETIIDLKNRRVF